MRGAREARPLSLTEDPRLSKASKGSQGFLRPRKVSWPQRGPGRLRGRRGAREARPLSLTEDPRLPKASEGSQGFLRPQEGPRGRERSREAQGARGSEGGEGEQGKHCP